MLRGIISCKGTARFRTPKTTFYSETSGGQNSNLHFNAVHFLQQQCKLDTLDMWLQSYGLALTATFKSIKQSQAEARGIRSMEFKF
jgi:hypothetical protein